MGPDFGRDLDKLLVMAGCLLLSIGIAVGILVGGFVALALVKLR